MIETLKHIFGTCGEAHLNIVSLTLIIMLANVIIKLKSKINE